MVATLSFSATSLICNVALIATVYSVMIAVGVVVCNGRRVSKLQSDSPWHKKLL